jgi:hypothetical protein
MFAGRAVSGCLLQSMDLATLHMDVSSLLESRHISPVARDLLSRLLVRDPARRLGAGGAAEIKVSPPTA